MRTVVLLCACVVLAGCNNFRQGPPLPETAEVSDETGYATEAECLYDKTLYESPIIGPVVRIVHPLSVMENAVLTTSLAPCVVPVSFY